MKKRVIINLATAAIAITVLLGGAADAGIYRIAPPGKFVTLQPDDFIQSVPDQSVELPNPNPVIGDNLGQHPGAFAGGFPSVGRFFVGVFGHAIDTSSHDAALYLWETSCCLGINYVPFAGPQVQLGYWNGMVFTPDGISQIASYVGTGVVANGFEITSSIIPLADFKGPQGFSSLLNAVRIEVTDAAAHNQVTAVAAVTVPESSTILLFAIGLIGLASYSELRKPYSVAEYVKRFRQL